MINVKMSRFHRERWLWELAFALNVALVARIEISLKPGLFKLQVRINDLLHLHYHDGAAGYFHNRVAGYLDAYRDALVWGLFIFLVLRLISPISLAERFLRWAAGLVCLALLPASWLYVGAGPTLPDPPHFWLYLELVMVCVCACLYVMNKWPAPIWASAALLGLHFIFWGWLFLGGPYFWLDMFRTVVPLVGFASSLVWGCYLLELRPHNSPPRISPSNLGKERAPGKPL